MEMHIDVWSVALSVLLGLALAAYAGFAKWALTKKEEHPESIILIPTVLGALSLAALPGYFIKILGDQVEDPMWSALTELAHAAIFFTAVFTGWGLLRICFPQLMKKKP